MSSYATYTQLQQLTLGSTALASIPTGDQQAACDSASTEADGYLASQYTLPLITWGTDLTEHVCNIAAYRLMGRRGYRAGGVDQGFKERYEEAVRWLTKVAQGVVSPPLIVDSTPGTREGAPAVLTGLGGNTVGASASPTVTLPGAKPYPFTGTIPGQRGW